jgi:hypothetical protein
MELYRNDLQHSSAEPCETPAALGGALAARTEACGVDVGEPRGRGIQEEGETLLSRRLKLARAPRRGSLA